MKKHLVDEPNFLVYLDELVNQNELEGAALGISKLLLDKGMDKLTKNQKWVFEKEVTQKFLNKKCRACGYGIIVDELSSASLNGGKHEWCAYIDEKIKDA